MDARRCLRCGSPVEGPGYRGVFGGFYCCRRCAEGLTCRCPHTRPAADDPTATLAVGQDTVKTLDHRSTT